MNKEIYPTLGTDEEIRDIASYEGQYAITSYGRVYSYKSNKFLSPFTDKNGYRIAVLSKKGKSKMHYLHRLVAEAFLANPMNKPEVNHLDECKSNNNILNLEWVTKSENVNYGTRNNRVANKNALNVRCIELDKTWPRAALAAKDMNVSTTAIRNACNGISKTSCGYHWEYVA